MIFNILSKKMKIRSIDRKSENFHGKYYIRDSYLEKKEFPFSKIR